MTKKNLIGFAILFALIITFSAYIYLAPNQFTSIDTPDPISELSVIYLTPEVKTGEEVTLRIKTPPAASIEAAVYYPDTVEPYILNSGTASPDRNIYWSDEAVWTWRVPEDTPTGEAKVIITASLVGANLVATKNFIINR